MTTSTRTNISAVARMIPAWRARHGGAVGSGAARRARRWWRWRSRARPAPRPRGRRRARRSGAEGSCIGNGADRQQRQPRLVGRERGECRHRLVRQQRQHQAGEDQELAGDDDLAQLQPARQGVQALAAGQQQHRGDGDADREPGRLGQRDRAQQIGEDVADRDHQLGRRRAGRSPPCGGGRDNRRRARLPSTTSPATSGSRRAVSSR